MYDFKLLEKNKDFLKDNSRALFLEGTTASGKTTIASPKAIFECKRSDKRSHAICALDIGTAERNIINQDMGLIDVFGSQIEYNANGKGDIKNSHIIIKGKTKEEDKIVYILSYGDKAKWKKALGGQYGVILVDEINTADMDFVRESFMRSDKFIATLNPDDPNLPIYKEYIDRSRPKDKYIKDYPKELLEMLNEPAEEGWTHYYFSFKDNAGLTEEKKKDIINSVPKGTKIYKNKILGLRGKATGLVFSNFDEKEHIITSKQAKYSDWEQEEPKKRRKYLVYTAGLDTAYSTTSPDTISMQFMGITDSNELITLDERVYNNATLNTPLAPSDVARNFVDFLDRNKDEWGLARNVFVDSADQATITELNKLKSREGLIYVFNNAYKKIKIVDRINYKLGWLANKSYLVVDKCKELIREMNTYSWREDKDNTPEDRNDHCINANQYGWMPYIEKIGKKG